MATLHHLCKRLLQSLDLSREELKDKHLSNLTVVEHAMRKVALDLGIIDTELNLRKTVPSREIVETLLEKAGAYLMEDDNPKLEMIKMNAYMTETWQKAKEILDADGTAVLKRRKEKIKEILDMKSFETETKQNRLYKNIFLLLTQERPSTDGLSAENIRIQDREIAAALESAFPREEIIQFGGKSRRVRKIQIERLHLVVLGIRIFNKFVGKGGAGIKLEFSQAAGAQPNSGDSQAASWQNSLRIESFIRMVENEIKENECICDQYLRVLYMEFDKPGTISSPIERLTNELANRKQYLTFLHGINESASAAKDLGLTLRAQLKLGLEDLDATIGNCQFITKALVFPKFARVAELYTELQEHPKSQDQRERVKNILSEFRVSISCSLNEHDLTSAEIHWKAKKAAGKEGASEAALKDLPTPELRSGDDRPQLVTIESQPDMAVKELEYGAFDPVSLVKRHGLLERGLREYLIKFKSRYYVFVRAENLVEFYKNPEKFIEGVELLVRKTHHELIPTLFLESQYPDLATVLPRTATEIPVKEQNLAEYVMTGSGHKKEISVQTPLHFPIDDFDPEYHWNEWELRRKALKLVSYRTKKTCSVQTEESTNKRDNATQDWVPQILPDGTMPGVAVQTKKDSATQPMDPKDCFAAAPYPN